MRLRSSVSIGTAGQGDPFAMPAARGGAGDVEVLPPPAERARPPAERPRPTGELGGRMREFRAALIGRLPAVANGPVTVVVAAAETGPRAGALAADLASASAQVGYDVLLVDANIARPSQHARFGMPNERGVSDMAEWMADGTQGIRATPVRGLAVITAGPFVANHAEMMERLGLCRRLAKIGRHLDMIVVDASALELSEAAATAGGSDGVIIVAERHRTPIAAIRRTAMAFADRGVAALGTVLVA